MWDVSTLFHRYQRDMTRYLRRRGVSADAAADIVQEAFLRVLAMRAGSQGQTAFAPDNPGGYLQRVVRNLSIDLARRECHAPFAGISVDELEDVADGLPSQERVIADRQRLAAVAAALDSLPDSTRRAFELYRLGDRTIADVAAELGLSTSWTGALIKSAYTHLREHLRDDIP